jgi:hypothetical protein
LANLECTKKEVIGWERDQWSRIFSSHRDSWGILKMEDHSESQDHSVSKLKIGGRKEGIQKWSPGKWLISST